MALFAGIVSGADIAAIASGVKSPAELLVVEDDPLQLAISGSGSNLELTWSSRAWMAYNIRTDEGGIGAVDPDSWPFYLSFTNIAATPPENMLTIPRPIGDDEAYFVAEEVPEP